MDWEHSLRGLSKPKEKDQRHTSDSSSKNRHGSSSSETSATRGNRSRHPSGASDTSSAGSTTPRPHHRPLASPRGFTPSVHTELGSLRSPSTPQEFHLYTTQRALEIGVSSRSKPPEYRNAPDYGNEVHVKVRFRRCECLHCRGLAESKPRIVDLRFSKLTGKTSIMCHPTAGIYYIMGSIYI